MCGLLSIDVKALVSNLAYLPLEGQQRAIDFQVEITIPLVSFGSLSGDVDDFCWRRTHSSSKRWRWEDYDDVLLPLGEERKGIEAVMRKETKRMRRYANRIEEKEKVKGKNQLNVWCCSNENLDLKSLRLDAFLVMSFFCVCVVVCVTGHVSLAFLSNLSQAHWTWQDLEVFFSPFLSSRRWSFHCKLQHRILYAMTISFFLLVIK